MSGKKAGSKLFFITLTTVFCAAAIAAQDFETIELDAPAMRGSKISYLDVIRRIFTDARIDENKPTFAIAEKTIPLRDLFDSAEKKNYGGEVSVQILARRETVDGGGRILWLLLWTGQEDKPDCWNCERRILAAFRFSGAEVVLLDAANVKTDDLTFFDSDRPVWRLAPRREAVMIWNVSQLSQMSDDEFSLVTADDDGFHLMIDQFDKQRDYRCGEWFDEAAQIRLLKTAVGGYRDIEIRVVTEAGAGDSDYAETKTRRRYRYVYKWRPRLKAYRAVVDPDRARRAFLKRKEPCRQ